jgi:hypothetical protein
MFLAGYTIDNVSLMALTIAVGFIIDDAVVMVENIIRHIEAGERPLEAALIGSREIGFTIVSMTLSLVAVFLPCRFLFGVEFATQFLDLRAQGFFKFLRAFHVTRHARRGNLRVQRQLFLGDFRGVDPIEFRKLRLLLLREFLARLAAHAFQRQFVG